MWSKGCVVGIHNWLLLEFFASEFICLCYLRVKRCKKRSTNYTILIADKGTCQSGPCSMMRPIRAYHGNVYRRGGLPALYPYESNQERCLVLFTYSTQHLVMTGDVCFYIRQYTRDLWVHCRAENIKVAGVDEGIHGNNAMYTGLSRRCKLLEGHDIYHSLSKVLMDGYTGILTQCAGVVFW